MMRQIVGIGLLLAVGIPVFIASNGERNASSSPQAETIVKPIDPEERLREELFRRDVQAVRRLKASLANPAAFELIEAVRMKDGTLCLSYRAQNAFGALIVNQAVIGKTIRTTGSDGFAATYNAQCANRSGENVRYIRQAL